MFTQPPKENKVYVTDCPDCDNTETEFILPDQRRCYKCGCTFMSHRYTYERRQQTT